MNRLQNSEFVRNYHMMINEFTAMKISDCPVVEKPQQVFRVENKKTIDGKSCVCDDETQKTVIREMKIDLTTLKDEIKRLDKKNERSVRNNPKLSNDLRAKYVDLEEKYVDLEEKFAKLQSAMENREDSFEKLTEENKLLTERIAMQNRCIVNFQDKIVGLEITKKLNESETAALKDKVLTLTDFVHETAEKNEKQRERMVRMSENVKTLKNDLENMERKNRELTDSHCQLEEANREKESHLNELIDLLDDIMIARRERSFANDVQCQRDDSGEELEIEGSKYEDPMVENHNRSEDPERESHVNESIDLHGGIMNVKIEKTLCVNYVQCQTEGTVEGLEIKLSKYMDPMVENDRHVHKDTNKITNEQTEDIKKLTSENDTLLESIENRTTDNQSLANLANEEHSEKICTSGMEGGDRNGNNEMQLEPLNSLPIEGHQSMTNHMENCHSKESVGNSGATHDLQPNQSEDEKKLARLERKRLRDNKRRRQWANRIRMENKEKLKALRRMENESHQS